MSHHQLYLLSFEIVPQSHISTILHKNWHSLLSIIFTVHILALWVFKNRLFLILLNPTNVSNFCLWIFIILILVVCSNSSSFNYCCFVGYYFFTEFVPSNFPAEAFKLFCLLFYSQKHTVPQHSGDMFLKYLKICLIYIVK